MAESVDDVLGWLEHRLEGLEGDELAQPCELTGADGRALLEEVRRLRRAERLLERIHQVAREHQGGHRLHVCRMECPHATEDLVRDTVACPVCGEFMLYVHPIARPTIKQLRMPVQETPALTQPATASTLRESEVIESPRQRDLFG